MSNTKAITLAFPLFCRHVNYLIDNDEELLSINYKFPLFGAGMGSEWNLGVEKVC